MSLFYNKMTADGALISNRKGDCSTAAALHRYNSLISGEGECSHKHHRLSLIVVKLDYNFIERIYATILNDLGSSQRVSLMLAFI